MGFLKKLFGGGDEKPTEYVDKTGIYFYAVCDNCGSRVKVRADKQHDLLREGSDFTWHKIIVDNKCFRRMQAVVTLDSSYNVTQAELSGGQFVSLEAYEAAEAAEAAQKAAAKAEAEAQAAAAENTVETAVDNSPADAAASEAE